MEPIILACIFVGFFVTLFSLPVWIPRAKKVGLSGKDIHKKDEKDVAEAGGIAVLIGFVLGVLVYVAIKTFYFKSTENLIEIFAILCSVLIVGFIGLMDDILGWKIGLTKRVRMVLVIFAAIPLMVINAGESTMMGIAFGIFYPLVLIPLGIVATSTTFNFMAGYNGLESSQGILILSALAIVTYFNGTTWLSLILVVMVACLLAFYLFNKCPAKVFPGDILTYSVGALIGIAAIMGNIEKIAVAIFSLYILEVILKSRGKLKVESFGKVDENGYLEKPRRKYYGVEHIAIDIIRKLKGRAKENQVVILINILQLIVIGVTFLVFRKSIF